MQTRRFVCCHAIVSCLSFFLLFLFFPSLILFFSFFLFRSFFLLPTFNGFLPFNLRILCSKDTLHHPSSLSCDRSYSYTMKKASNWAAKWFASPSPPFSPSGDPSTPRSVHSTISSSSQPRRLNSDKSKHSILIKSPTIRQSVSKPTMSLCNTTLMVSSDPPPRLLQSPAAPSTRLRPPFTTVTLPCLDVDTTPSRKIARSSSLGNAITPTRKAASPRLHHLLPTSDLALTKGT